MSFSNQSDNLVDPFEALKKGDLFFKFRVLRPDYSAKDVSRISGVFVLCVIAVLAICITASYLMQSKDDTFMIISLMICVMIGYRIMNAKLTNFTYTGKAIMYADRIIFSDMADNEEEEFYYSSIKKIKGEPGVDVQVFISAKRNSMQEKRYQSFIVSFYLDDETVYQTQLSTDVILLGGNVTFRPTLDDCLRFLDRDHEIVDGIQERFNKKFG